MSKRPRVLRVQRKFIGDFERVNPNAAGIDAGSEMHYVSVPEDRDAEAVREFGTFTSELNALADWLVACGITTVAIEATGVYWIPLYEILEQRGLNPRLVDSRSIGKRSRKTDVLDCQWIRQLHMYGLLNAAFRPAAEILPVRALMRQRRTLIEASAEQIQHMQKALDQMNVKLHLVLSDIVGVTGRRIIEAILAGNTTPEELAALREAGCKASVEKFVAALQGNYRSEHLFVLRQSVSLFDTYQRLIADCDATIEQELGRITKSTDPKPKRRATRPKRRKNQIHFDARTKLEEISGVDMTTLPGLDAASVLTITSETGFDLSPWRSSSDWSAWLNLAPNPRITGGKPIRRGARVIRPNRAAQAFRLAAQTLERAQCALGAFFRRMRGRYGRRYAIKATAHKLAVIFYAMLKSQTPYAEPGADYYERRYHDNLVNSLTRKAKELGYVLTPMDLVH